MEELHEAVDSVLVSPDIAVKTADLIIGKPVPEPAVVVKLPERERLGRRAFITDEMDSQGKDFLPCVREGFLQRLKEADFLGGKLQRKIGTVVETAGELARLSSRSGLFLNPYGSVCVVLPVREKLPVFPVRIEKAFLRISQLAD